MVQLTPASVSTWGLESGLSVANVRSVALLDADHLLAGTYGAGIVDIIHGTASPAPPAEPPTADSRYVLAVHADRQGNVWAGTCGAGLFRRSADTSSEWQAAGLGDSTVHAIYEDTRDTVWFGLDTGLARFRNRTLEVLGPEHQVPSGAVTALAEDPESGSIWLGIQGKGLTRFANDRAVRVDVPSGWNAALEDIAALLAQTDQTLWIGTESGGLFRWRAGQLAPAELPETIPQLGSSCLITDAQGNVWMGTSRGLVRMSFADLNAAVDHDRPIGGFTVLDQHQGMLNPECAYGSQPAAARGPDGRLYFATLGGVAVVDPAQIPPPSPPSEIALRESEERFRQRAGSIREVFYLVDWPDRHYVYASPAFETIWGRRTADLYANPARWSGAISPQYRDRVARGLEQHIDRGPPIIGRLGIQRMTRRLRRPQPHRRRRTLRRSHRPPELYTLSVPEPRCGPVPNAGQSMCRQSSPRSSRGKPAPTESRPRIQSAQTHQRAAAYRQSYGRTGNPHG